MSTPPPAVVTPPPPAGLAFTTRPTLTGTFGMAASTHWLASQSAQRMLELGGNAADAAAAAGFVLHVVEPHLNGPGGDLTGVVAMADGDGFTTRVLDGQGPAPAGASAAAYRAMGLELVPGAGPLAAAVPGAVDAWLILLRDHGTLPIGTVLEPAIGYARDGHPVLAAVTRTVAMVQELFTEHWPTSAELWLRDGAAPTAGDLITNPAYAAVLQGLVDAADAAAAGSDVAAQAEAARVAWRDAVAPAAGAFAAQPTRHAGGPVLPGVLTAEDVRGWSAGWEDPITLEFQGVTLAKTGPWGQGPTLLQVLGTLQALAERTGDRAVLDPDTATGAHALVEAWKLAMADREAYYGESDGDVEDAEGRALAADLLAPEYLAQRAALIEERVVDGLRPGAPGGRTAVLAEHVRRVMAGESGIVERDVTAGEPTVRQPAPTGATPEQVEADPDARGDTCHVDVVDRWGQMVSVTPSGGWLQSSPTIPELGFCLGTRLQMCWLDEGLPATLTPGRRPRTTLTPTLVTDAGAPVLACGSPGGDQQDQWQSVLLLRLLAGGAGLQEAIDAPMLHSRHAPESFWPRDAAPHVIALEDRVAPEVQAELERRGHVLQHTGPWSLGRLSAVARDPRTGLLSAAANPRGMQGYAVGR